MALLRGAGGFTMRRSSLRLWALSILAAAAVLAAPGIAYADSDQRCSQRGGKNNTVTCKSLITVGDVTVNLTGNRILTNSEVISIEDNVLTVIGVCNATGKSNQACTVDILNVVVNVTKSFNNYNLLSIIVTKGHGKSKKTCPC